MTESTKTNGYARVTPEQAKAFRDADTTGTWSDDGKVWTSNDGTRRHDFSCSGEPGWSLPAREPDHTYESDGSYLSLWS